MHRTTRLTREEILHFTFQLSILLNQQFFLPDGLRLIQQTTGSPKLKKWIKRLLFHLEEGEDFHQALIQETRGFTTFYLSLVQSGLSSSSLGKHLKSLYHFLRSRNAYEAKMKKASFYPLFLLVLTISISVGMMLFLLPMITEISSTLQVTLPRPITRMMEAIAWIKSYALVVIGGCLFSTLLGYWVYQKNRYLLHGILLKIPVLGTFIRKNNLFLFFQELALLLNDQIAIEEAIPIASQSIQNAYLRDQVELSSLPLQHGKTFSDIFQKFPGKDTFLLSMIKSGEETNQLAENIDFALQVLQQELEQKQERFISSIEPVMLLFIGSMVLMLVVNLYFPIFEMINSMDMLNTI